MLGIARALRLRWLGVSLGSALALPAVVAAGCAKDPPVAGGGASSAKALGSAPGSAAGAGAVPFSSSAAAGERWPELPRSEAEVRSLIQAYTRRSPAPEQALDSERLENALLEAARKNELHAGWEDIARFVAARADHAVSGGRPSFLLVGNFHDAPAQIVAFRRLSGVVGSKLGDATIEQLHADGHWAGVEPSAQLGDSLNVARFAEQGDRNSLEALVAGQREHNHTAWKYDYLEEMPALFATLRTSGVVLHACDMPGALQSRVRHLGDGSAMSLRELHCVRSLEDALAGRKTPARVAMLWGAEHIGAGGVQRFLPANADVVAISLFGGRPAEARGIETGIELRHRLESPLLFPFQGNDRFALVLAEGAARANVDRTRDADLADSAERLGKLLLTSTTEVELWVGGRSVRVGEKVVSVVLPPGQHAFVAIPKQPPRLCGAIAMPEHGYVELGLDPSHAEIRLVTHQGR